MGLLASLDRPGGNVTGVIFFGVTLGSTAGSAAIGRRLNRRRQLRIRALNGSSDGKADNPDT
jgi:hypothetical protein